MHYDFWARSAGKRNRAVRCNLFPALKAGKGFPLPSLAQTFCTTYTSRSALMPSKKKTLKAKLGKK